MATVLKPRISEIGIFQEPCLLLLEGVDGHVLPADNIRVLLEELLSVRLENLPRGIGDDGVESASLVEDLVELEAPVKRFELIDVCGLDRPLQGFSQVVFLGIPGGLFVLDSKFFKVA